MSTMTACEWKRPERSKMARILTKQSLEMKEEREIDIWSRQRQFYEVKCDLPSHLRATTVVRARCRALKSCQFSWAAGSSSIIERFGRDSGAFRQDATGRC